MKPFQASELKLLDGVALRNMTGCYNTGLRLLKKPFKVPKEYSKKILDLNFLITRKMNKRFFFAIPTTFLKDRKPQKIAEKSPKNDLLKRITCVKKISQLSTAALNLSLGLWSFSLEVI